MTFPLQRDPDEGVRPLLVGMGWIHGEPGGLNRYFADLISALRQKGIYIQAVVTSKETELPLGVVSVDAPESPLWKRGLAFRKFLQRMEQTPTVVDSHFALHGLMRWSDRRLRRIPLVVHFQGPWAAEARLEGRGGLATERARRALERFVYRRADEIVTLSHAFRDIAIQSYGVLPSRVHVDPPGVDLQKFSPTRVPAVLEGLREGRSPVVLAVRRLNARMGLDVLLRAWSLANLGGLLVIAGSGPEEGRLRAAATVLGLQDNVRFLGAVSDVELADWYGAADLTVVPSTALEGFGLVVLESLASGTLVIASDTGGMAETLGALDPRLLVPPGDVRALATLMAYVLEQRTDFPDPGECRAFAEAFTWAGVGERMADLYARVGATGINKPLRVVFLTHTAALGGGELAMLRLIEGLKDVLPHVVVGESGPLTDLLAARGIDHEIVAIRGLGRIRRDRVGIGAPMRGAIYVFKLSVRLRQLRPDLVHTNSLKAGILGSAAARLAGLPVIWHCRDRLDKDYLSTWTTRILRHAIRILPHAVIANSRSTLDTLSTRTRTNAVVIGSPQSLILGPRNASEKAPIVVIALGRLCHWKGQHIAIQAFAEAFPFGAERLRIVGGPLFGEDAYERGIRRLVRELDLDRRVDFVGHRSDVAEQLATGDVLLHSSLIPEPFGNVILEGMAAGLAVIASDAGGPKELIKHDEDGLLFPIGDVSALADILRRLSEDVGLRLRLGERAQAAVAPYSTRSICEKTEGFYRFVVGEHKNLAPLRAVT